MKERTSHARLRMAREFGWKWWISLETAGRYVRWVG